MVEYSESTEYVKQHSHYHEYSPLLNVLRQTYRDEKCPNFYFNFDNAYLKIESSNPYSQKGLILKNLNKLDNYLRKNTEKYDKPYVNKGISCYQ